MIVTESSVLTWSVTDVSEAGLRFATATALLIRLKRIRNVSFESATTEALQLWLISKEKSLGAAGASRSATWRAIPIISTPRRRARLSAPAVRSRASLHKAAPRVSKACAALAALAPLGPDRRCSVSRWSPTVARRLRSISRFGAARTGQTLQRFEMERHGGKEVAQH